MKVQLYIDPACQLSKVPYQVPNNTHYVLYDDYSRLKAEVERSRDQYNGIIDTQLAVIDSLKAEVERLTKAVMHSPAAQLKLKELEGKTTFEEINGKIPPCIDKYEAK
jgi:hypothetical protein